MRKKIQRKHKSIKPKQKMTIPQHFLPAHPVKQVNRPCSFAQTPTKIAKPGAWQTIFSGAPSFDEVETKRERHLPFKQSNITGEAPSSTINAGSMFCIRNTKDCAAGYWSNALQHSHICNVNKHAYHLQCAIPSQPMLRLSSTTSLTLKKYYAAHLKLI